MSYFRSIGVLFGILVIAGCYSRPVAPDVFLGDEESDDSMMIKLIWTQWMGKPELQYDRIDRSEVGDVIGRWSGSSAVSGQQTEFDVEINRDGSWESSIFLAEGAQGLWRLSDGLILLYFQPSEGRNECWSALFRKDNQLHLIAADVESGLVTLEKVGER